MLLRTVHLRLLPNPLFLRLVVVFLIFLASPSPPPPFTLIAPIPPHWSFYYSCAYSFFSPILHPFLLLVLPFLLFLILFLQSILFHLLLDLILSPIHSISFYTRSHVAPSIPSPFTSYILSFDPPPNDPHYPSPVPLYIVFSFYYLSCSFF